MKSLNELEHQLNPLSAKEAAMIYGDSLSNFYKMIRQGEVPGVHRKKPKGRIKICPKEFVPWIRALFTAVRDANHGAVEVQPKKNGLTPSVKTDEQDRSRPEVDYGCEKDRREDDVA